MKNIPLIHLFLPRFTFLFCSIYHNGFTLHAHGSQSVTALRLSNLSICPLTQLATIFISASCIKSYQSKKFGTADYYYLLSSLVLKKYCKTLQSYENLKIYRKQALNHLDFISVERYVIIYIYCRDIVYHRC